MTECVNCSAPLGDGPKELPVFCPDDGGEGGGKIETWCPQCFKHVRMPAEGSRLSALMIDAVRCRSCGVTSAEVGRGRCNQCSSANIETLGPKRGTVDPPAEAV
jgi:hypothetical protein